MKIDKLINLSNLAAKQGKAVKLQRKLLKQIISHRDKTILGILGPRGVVAAQRV